MEHRAAPKLSWQVRLMALFALVLGASLLFQLLYVIPHIRKHEVAVAEAHQQDIARNIARELDRDLTQTYGRLAEMAQRAEFRSMHTASVQQAIATVTAGSYRFEDLSVLDADGGIVASTLGACPAQASAGHADRPYFTVPIKQGEAYFGPPMFYPHTKVVVTSVCVPIESQAGKRVGVLMGRFKLNHLIESVTDYPGTRDGLTVCVVDRQGRAVAQSGMDMFALEAGPLSLNYSDRPLVRAAMRGTETAFREHHGTRGPYFGCSRVLRSNGWGVVLTASKRAILGRSTEITKWMLRANAALFAVALAASALSARRITARQTHLETVLRASEEKYRHLFDRLTDAAFLADADTGLIIETNQEGEKLLGRSRDEIVGMHQSAFHPPDKAEEYKCMFANHISQGRPAYAEADIIRKDGTTVPVRINATTMVIGDRHLILGLFRDITERKRAEEALRRSQERYRDLVEGVDYLVTQVDREGRLIFVNHAAMKVFGLEPRQCVGLSAFDFVHPDDRARTREAFAGWVRDGRRSVTFENRQIGRGGQVRDMLWTIALHFDDAGNMTTIDSIAHDITDRKEVEAERIEYQRQLQELALQLASAEDRERRRVATDLHDQVGQSLAALSMNLQVLRKAGLSEEQACALNESLTLLKQMSADIRVLTFKLCPPMLYETGLAPALAWLVEQFQQKHAGVFEFEDDGQAKLVGHDVRGLMFRGVRELLINAAKHAHAHHVKVSMEATGGHLKVTVKDDGIGLDVSKMSSPGQGSTGFGLFSIRERLHHLGGHLYVRSQPGRGSCLTIAVPFVPDNAQGRARTVASTQ